MAWFWFAVMSAVLWGLSYLMYERVIESVSSAGALLFTVSGGCFVYLAAMLMTGSVRADWDIVKRGGTETWLVLALILINALANLTIMMSIQQKNAALAGMIEITYPLFTVFFAWLFLRELQLNPGTWIGAALVFAGVSCIFYFEK